MPTYDFRCQACGHQFAQKVSYQEKDNLCCTNCGANQVKQIFTRVNIGKASKGSGGSASACSSCKGGTCC